MDQNGGTEKGTAHSMGPTWDRDRPVSFYHFWPEFSSVTSIELNINIYLYHCSTTDHFYAKLIL